MTGARLLALLVFATALLVSGAPAAQDVPSQPAGIALAPPSPAERQRRAAVIVADYRYGDILWENDRTAHRIYGHALEAVEPPSSSGIDAWGKHVPWPFMDRQLRTGKQHDDHGEGVDFYNVNGSRGAGGLGIWHDNKLWVSRNYARHRILQNGPKVAAFEVDYDPWPVDVVRRVWETRRFTLPAGTNFTRMVSTIRSDRPGTLTVAIGIAKRAVSDTPGRFTADTATGRITWWGPTDPAKGTMAIALMVDPRDLVGITADYDNHLVLLKVVPGRPFVYYMGAAWDRDGQFRTADEWGDNLAAQRPDFDPRH